jgi:hypothetical protein
MRLVFQDGSGTNKKGSGFGFLTLFPVFLDKKRQEQVLVLNPR